MRKFSKILAVLLALCLLCGAIVMSAGATSDTFTIANASNSGKAMASLTPVESLLVPNDADGRAVTNYYALDFETQTSGRGFSARLNILSATGGNTIMTYYSTNGYVKNPMYDIVKTATGTAGRNNFYCIQPHAQFAPSFVDSYPTATKAQPQILLSTPMVSTLSPEKIAADPANLANAAYGVVDFDLATDRYKFKNADGQWRVAYPSEITDNGDGTWSWANPANGGKLETVTDLGLAYDTTKWGITTVAPTSAANGSSYKITKNEKFYFFKFVEVNDEWCIYTNNDVDTGARLSNEVLEWNHFTFVIARDAGNLGASMLYCYLDGVCFFKTTANSSATNTNSLYLQNFQIDWGLGESKVWDKSTAIDNLTSNFYPIGWNSGDAYGIDDYFASVPADIAEMAPLYNCSDVIYKNGYTYGYPMAGFATLNNETDKYTIPATINAYLQENLETEDVVKLNGISLENFVVPEGVDGFTVDVSNGATFSLAEGQLYSASRAGTTYTVEAVSYDREILVKWYDASGKFISEGTYVYGDTLKAPEYALSNSLASTKDKGTITTIYADGWMYDIDGDEDMFEPTAINKIDEDLYLNLELQAMMEDNLDGPMVLNVKATSTRAEDTVVTGFIVYTTDENGNVVVSAMENAWDRNKALIATWNAPTDSTLVFYVDTVSFHLSKGYIAVSNGKSLTVDLNGHTIKGQVASGSAATSGMFMVGNGSTLTITSSVEGAILSYCFFNTSNSTVSSTAMIQFADMTGTITGDKAVKAALTTNSTVNINGENIEFYTGAIAGAPSEWCYDISEETQNEVNIDGGIFNVTYNYQAFNNNGNFAYNVENAKFNLGANMLFHNNAGRYFRTVATFTNCEIFSEGPIFGRADTTNSYAEYTFNGCTIVGFDDAKSVTVNEETNEEIITSLFTIAKVYLGAGNRISGSYSNIEILDGAFVARNNSGLAVGTVSLTGNKIENFTYSNSTGWTAWTPTAFTVSGEVNLVTYANEADCLADGFVKVEWLAPNGDVYVTDYYYPGSTIEHLPDPELSAPAVPSGVDNWTGTGCTGWANVEVGTVVTEAMTVNPVIGTVGCITGLKANLTLTGQQYFNLYLPKYEGEGFELVGIDGKNFSGYGVTIGNYITLADGKEYIMITTRFAPYDLVAFDATVNFKIGEAEYSAVVTFDFFKYADSVFAMPEYACGSEAATLLFNLLQFKREAYIYKFNVVDKNKYDQAVVDNIDKYLNDKHGDNCACMTDITGNVDFSIDLGEKGMLSVSYDKDGKPVYGDGSVYGRGKLDGVMTAVQYSMNSGNPTVVFYINMDICENVTGVQVRFRRAIVGENVVEWTDYMTVSARTSDETVYRYQIADIPMHMQACLMEVAVTFEDGTTKTGNYSLSEYCQATMSQNEWAAEATTYEQCQKAAKAFYALSKAAFAYKTAPNATIE